MNAYISPRIRLRLVALSVIAWGTAYGADGIGIRSAAQGAALYCGLIGFLLILRFIVPNLRVFLPEEQGHGVASATGLLYWGIGWVFPLVSAGMAFWQPGALSHGDRLILVLSATVACWSAYALLIEPIWATVRVYELATPGASAALNGFRIVHVSDTHWRCPGKLVSRVVDRIRDLRPDIICVTGDLADTLEVRASASVQAVGQFFQGLQARYGIYVVLGDWDGLAGSWPAVAQAMLENPSVHVLNDALCSVPSPGADVWIMGRAPAHLGARPDYMAELPKEGFTIVLHHYPFGAIRAAELGAHLYLAGHTHGGQICLPWVGGLTSTARGGKDRTGRILPRRYNGGLHRMGGTWVHISRGLGTRGGDAPPIRFCCRPEIGLLTFSTDND